MIGVYCIFIAFLLVFPCLAAHDMFSGEFKQGFAKVILKSDEVGPGDAKDAAFEYGHYTFCDKDDKQLDYGK